MRFFIKKTEKAFLLEIILLTVFAFVGFFVKPVTAFAWDIDKTVEPSRDIGTDLYDESKAYNVMPLNITISDGSKAAKLLDEDYSTSVALKNGTEIKVTCESPMYSIYIIWDSLVPEWTMKIGDKTYTYGQNGFIHEYVVLPEMTSEFTIIIPDGSVLGDLAGVYKGGMRVSDIYAYPDSCIPAYVQVWEPSLTDADILIFSTHGDDEHIFFGGFLPLYGAEQGKKVQMAYLTQHWVYSSTSKIREHEKLNGLWLAGAVNYPYQANFGDSYSETLKDAQKNINLDDAISFVADTIRQCHPLTVVIHDKNGEYGHGQHRLNSAAGVEAVKLASISTYNPESAAKYGTWDTPKLYMHIDTDNQVVLNLRTPLEAFGGKTAIQVARQAYLCHQSQQKWTTFTVDDYGKYNNAKFGLVYSTVGLDKNHDDILENLRDADEAAIRAKAATPKTGTDADFTPIYTADDLLLMEKDCYGKFILMNDIDMNGIEWKPIDFYGVFNGNGHAILNLKVTALTDNTVNTVDGNRKEYATHFSGFFGLVRHAEIYDLSLLGINVDVDADCDTFIGTLAGYTYDTVIKNCTVIGAASLKVTGKMFGVGGLIGFGGSTKIYDSTIDTILINIDKDATTRDEQFLGGVFGDGYIDLEGCTIKVKGYTSDHGYVHDGGIAGMYILYDKTSHSGFIKNNKVEGFVRFFEDNKDRRAYCKAIIGENMSSSKVSISGNKENFKRDEVKVYDTDLLPHYCTNNQYTSEEVKTDCKEYGYILYTCSECNEYSYKVYLLPEHTLDTENASVVIEPTYTTTGISKIHCSVCDKDVYNVLDVIPMPTPTPTPTPEPTSTPVPTVTNTPVFTRVPDNGSNGTDTDALYNNFLVIICVIIIIITLSFIPVLVKKHNR